MTTFETYDFQSDPKWQEIEMNLLIPPDADHDTIILKKKAQFYQRNVDPTFKVPSSTTSTSSTSSNTDTDNNTSQSSYQSETPPPSSSSYTSASSSSSYSSSTSSSSSRRPKTGKLTILLAYFQLMNHIFLIFLSVFFFLPILGQAMSAQCFYLVLYLSIFLNIFHLARTYGRPKWSRDYGQTILQDDHSQFIMYAGIMNTSTPMLLSLLPIVARSVVFIARAFDVVLPKYLPNSIHSRLKPYIRKVTENGMEIYRWVATLEIFTGITLIIQLFMRTRNFLLTFLFWQYLRFRYTVSTDSRYAFGSIRMSLDQKILYNPKCPAFIGTIYSKIVAFLASQADPQQQRSMCTIM